MSVLDCIARLHKEGKINDRQRREAEEIYNGVYGRLYPNMPAASAEARAALDTARILEESAKQRRYALAKNAIAAQQGLDRIQQHPNGPIAGFMGLLSRDIWTKGGVNVESLAADYAGRAARELNGVVEKYGSKFAGLKQDVAGIRDMIREGFGQDTGSQPAKELAEAWKAAHTYLSDEAKRLGKVFSPAEDWRFPQWWEGYRARYFKPAQLISDWRKHVDAGGLKVFDADTGQEANPIRREEIMAAAARKIAKDLPFEYGIGGAFSPEMRIFRFAEGKAGADAYLELMDKYGIGSGGYLEALAGHVRATSRQLASMNILGPDWRTTGQGLLNKALDLHAERELEGPPKTIPEKLGEFARAGFESPAAARRLWDYMSGRNSQVGGEALSAFFSGWRGFIVARKLGSGLFTALPTDSVNALLSAHHLGLDTGRLASDLGKTFVADSAESRARAARLGIDAMAAVDHAIGTKRFSDQLFGEKFMTRLGSFTVRATGLAHWDATLRRSFLMEFLGSIGDRAGKSFDEVDGPFKDNFLTRYNITPEEWKTIADPANHLDMAGVRYLDPDALSAKNEPLRQKLLSAIYDQKQFAHIVGGSARVASIRAQAPAGSLAGEASRNFFLFKTWPVTYLSTWLLRAATEPGWEAKAAVATRLIGFGTMAGAMTLGAKSIVQGKDWPDMSSPWFWAEASLQGSVAGIYSDFVRGLFSRDKTTMLEGFLGPWSSDIGDVTDLLTGARSELQEGTKPNWGKRLADFGSHMTPGGSAWYARLMLQRLVWDQFQKQLDPEYYRSFQRQRERSIKLRNQDFYWRPGETSPSRLPQ